MGEKEITDIAILYIVFLKDIESDQSENKLVSHGRLVGFTSKYKDAGLCRVYSKSQLLLLCEAYGVRVTTRSNKTILSNKLMEAITTHTFILLMIASIRWLNLLKLMDSLEFVFA